MYTRNLYVNCCSSELLDYLDREFLNWENFYYSQRLAIQENLYLGKITHYTVIAIYKWSYKCHVQTVLDIVTQVKLKHVTLQYIVTCVQLTSLTDDSLELSDFLIHFTYIIGYNMRAYTLMKKITTNKP